MKHLFERATTCYDLYISFSEAALGVSKDIELIGGKVRIKLEAGIQSGKTPAFARQRNSRAQWLWKGRCPYPC